MSTMTRLNKRGRLWVAVVGILVIASACTSTAETTTSTSDTQTTVTTVASTTTSDAGTVETTTAPSETVGDLSKCPNPIVIQTDWFPQPEHGPLYQLTGGEGSINPETGVFTGPFTADPSIEIELRAGGPYIGFQQTVTLAYADDSIMFAAVALDDLIPHYTTAPLLAVVAPIDRNPIGMMWDPDTYDFKSYSDIGESGAVVSVFPGQYWIDYFVGSGQLTAEQIDGSYDGSPTRFIAEEGALVQQAFGTQEPYNYLNVYEDWAKPVAFLSAHDAGYENYSMMMGIRPDKLDADMEECLFALVPYFQQASVDFGNDPGPVNAAIVQAVADLDSFWTQSPESAANTVAQMIEMQILSDGSDNITGNFDLARVATLMDQVRPIPSFEFPDGLNPEDLVTNKYIDPSIGR